LEVLRLALAGDVDWVAARLAAAAERWDSCVPAATAAAEVAVNMREAGRSDVDASLCVRLAGIPLSVPADAACGRRRWQRCRDALGDGLEQLSAVAESAEAAAAAARAETADTLAAAAAAVADSMPLPRVDADVQTEAELEADPVVTDAPAAASPGGGPDAASGAMVPVLQLSDLRALSESAVQTEAVRTVWRMAWTRADWLVC
jgi:hypothetical protein